MRQDQGADRLTAVLRDSNSESWSRRAAAGRQLAAWAEREEVGPIIERLLLDAHDTAVTQETAQALLERRDLVGLRAVLAALSRAEAWWTADQLDGEVFGFQSWMIADDRADEFMDQLVSLAADQDKGVRHEALRLSRPTEQP
ncbi:HEAT repeat domain-containing protein [Streptomyces sp. NPDC004262]